VELACVEASESRELLALLLAERARLEVERAA
jgi:hypothetical protein